MTETNKLSQQEIKKPSNIKMIAITIILSAILVFLVIMYFDQRGKMVEMETILTQEKDSLTNELKGMIFAYDTLKTNNDTLNANLERKRTVLFSF